jgi:UDP-glucuronate decarboxylase
MYVCITTTTTMTTTEATTATTTEATTATARKTILVTGGAGFIGSNLCTHLLSQSPDNHVICVDNLITGHLDNLGDNAAMNPRFRFIEYDITNPIDPTLFGEEHIDEIYHLASIASPEKYKKYPMETLLTSINGTQRVLDYCVLYNCKMLFTSTSEVYGDPLVHPQPETYYGNVNTVGERSCYDEGKRVAETLVYEYQKRFPDLDLKVARLFNTYGPRMDLDDGRVITNFIRQIKRGASVEIYGDGTQTRSFCYVDDMVRGLVAFMGAAETSVGDVGPVNIGNPDCEFTMNELVEVFRRVLRRPEGDGDALAFAVKYLPRTQDDPMCRRPVITKAQELFGFRCDVGLEEGIQCVWDYFQ